jgi:tetratricopeptide (TPR) repeat protein
MTQSKIGNTMCSNISAVAAPTLRVKALSVLLLLPFILASFLPAQAQSEPGENDPRVMRLYTEAKSAEQSGDMAGAVAKYKSILAIAPRLAPAYNNLGALYLKQRQYRQAADVLKRGLSVDPSMYSATVLLGISLYEAGAYADARDPLERAVRENPKDGNAELYLANDLIKLEQFQPAAIHLEQLAKREPQNQQVWYILGNVYIHLSEEAFAKIDSIDPNSVLSHELRGDIMASMKNFDGALVQYKKAVDIAPRQPGTHYKLGDAYWQLNDWSDATQQFQAELANDPENCDAQWKLGNILLEQHQDPGEALVDIDKALAICPSLMAAKEDRATALIRLGRFADALPDLRAAVEANPEASRPHFMLSQAYRGLGRTKEANAEMAIFAKLEQEARAAEAKHTEDVMRQKSKIPDNQQP